MTRFIMILLAASLLAWGMASCGSSAKTGNKAAGGSTDAGATSGGLKKKAEESSGHGAGNDHAQDTVTTASGLKYIDLKVGTGASPQSGDTVTVHYTGWLTDGKKFDSSKDRSEPFKFPIGKGRVIKGWDEGVATMKVGGTRKLIIPPQLGYGARGFPPVIPPNSVLIFDVDLLSVR